MIKKIIEYIKNNKLYVAVMLIGLLLFAIQMKFVVLYADDLSLGIIAKTGLKGAFQHLIENYMNWGGGPTPFIAIVFLMFPLKVWKIVNCAIVVMIIALAIKMITHSSKINKAIIATVLWILVFILNIYISAETLYWLDGNLAYVLTAFQMLLFFYYLYSRLIMKTEAKKYDMVLLPLVAFFAGWTGPQSGALTVIMTALLLIWVRVAKKEKIKPIYYIASVIGLIGFLVYYLAPGNNARLVAAFPELADYGLVEKIGHQMSTVWKLLFDFMTYRFASIPTYLYLTMGLMGAVTIKIAQKEQNKRVRIVAKSMGVILFGFIILNFAIFLGYNPGEIFSNICYRFEPILENIQAGTFNIKMLVPYATTSIIMIIMVVSSYYISTKEKTPLLFIFVVGALLGQGMMVLAPYSPLRSTFITVMLLWFAIAYLAKMIYEQEVSILWILALILGIMYDKNILFIMIITYFIFVNLPREKIKEEKPKTSFAIEGSIILVLGVVIAGIIYGTTLLGYKKNKVVYEENIKLIQEFKEQKEEKILYLKEPVDKKYGFTSFIGIGWIEKATKEYFELEENVEIKSMNQITEQQN